MSKKKEGGGEPVFDLEQQFIMRLPPVSWIRFFKYARSLLDIIIMGPHCIVLFQYLIENITRHYKLDNTVFISKTVETEIILFDIFKNIFSYFGYWLSA